MCALSERICTRKMQLSGGKIFTLTPGIRATRVRRPPPRTWKATTNPAARGSRMSPRPVATLVAALTFAACLWRGWAAPADSSSDDVIVVLAGGVNNAGVPHETVMRRLRRAADLYKQQLAETGTAPAIVCNGGGTTHKPKWVDANGYSVPEAALMGQQLLGMGVRDTDIYAEGYSDDTIGNAFFLRVMLLDSRPEWSRLRVITSAFQMERTKAIYSWVMGLTPMPAEKRGYRLVYETVDDDGALPRHVLQSRLAREAQSLRTFQSGELVRNTRLAELHKFIYLRHAGYTAQGFLRKKALQRGSALSQTY